MGRGLEFRPVDKSRQSNQFACMSGGERVNMVTQGRALARHEAHEEDWWRTAVIYQIYPRSFASTTDGVGDLPGITSRLDYVASIGVDAVWLSPFYSSPQNDHGYDVADYRDVDPMFGTLTDATALIARAGELGLKVIVDLVPNHTSNEHPWFREALASGKGSPARERYWFRDGKGENGELPPTDWESVFGGPAWTRVEDGQWYLHLFDSSQPDLNWDHPEVREEFDSILRFWLDRGVAGFRVDVAHGLAKDPALPDFASHAAMIAGLGDDAPAGPEPMWDRDEVHEIYRRWRRVLDEYPESMMCGEVWVGDGERRSRYVRADEMHQCFNFAFLSSPWNATDIGSVIADSLAANDAVGAPTTWVLSNHDVIRTVSRMGLSETGKGPNGLFASDERPDLALGERRAKAAQLLMLALPGAAYLYNGEELGLPEHDHLPDEVRQDPAFERTGRAEPGRDGCRIPLPWEADKPGAGFSPTGETWLPQPHGWADYAADRQKDDPDSYLSFIRQALAYRARYGLGGAGLTEREAPEGALVYDIGELRVMTVFTGTATIPDGWRVLLASAAVEDEIGPDTTVWLARS